MPKAPANFLGAHGGLAKRALGEDEREFFATVAAGHVFRTHAAQKSLADGRQGLVAGGVSEIIVVAFEVVEIEHHDGEGTAFPARGVEFAIEELLHVTTVVEAGERVADSLQAERFTEVEVGNRDRDLFAGGGGELAAASKRVGVSVSVWVGNGG